MQKIEKISRGLIGVFIVVFIVGTVSIYSYGLFDLANWKVPPAYGKGDAVWALKLLDSAAKGQLKPFQQFSSSELGAPYSANYSDWPTGMALEMQPGGWVINLFGLSMGCNIYLILCHITAALSMFLSLRFMRTRALWAVVFGIVFGLCPYLFYRNFAHVTLINTAYLVPVACAAIWYLFIHNPDKAERPHIFLLLFFSFFIGAQNPYYSAPYLWALPAVGVFWFLKTKKARCLLLPSACIGAFFGGFLIGVSPTFLHSFYEGKNFEAVTRFYANVQQAVLRPVEMFLPGSGSGIPILDKLSQFYENQCLYRLTFNVSESMAPYLGLAGCVCFISLFSHAILCILQQRQEKITGWFWLVVFLLAFSVLGGLNGFLGLGKFYFLRSSNRFSIFILAACLIFVAIWLSSHPRLRRGWIPVFVAMLLGGLAIVEPMLPRALGAELHRHHEDVMFWKKGSTQRVERAQKFESDRKFALELERSLPKGGMLFNYPVMQLPESLSYDYFRPAFFTNEVRYSFGAIKGRARDTWQPRVEKLEPMEMVAELKKYGFSGVLVYTGEDLPDAWRPQVAKLAETFRHNHLNGIKSALGDFEFFGFEADPSPEFPEAEIKFVKGWWGGEIQPEHFPGTPNASNEKWRWATHSSAIVEVFNEKLQERTFKLRGRILDTKNSNLQILVNDREVFSGAISADAPTGFTTAPIDLAGQKSVRLQFKTNQKPVVIDGRKFSFAVSSLEFKWLPAQFPQKMKRIDKKANN